MNVYIAAHSLGTARVIAELLRGSGHSISSTWILEPMESTENVPPPDRPRIAARDAREVRESDCLVLLASESYVPGGKFVEAGIALGRDIPVIVFGRRENMLCYHPAIRHAESVYALLGVLRGIEAVRQIDALESPGVLPRSLSLVT